jgi:putative transcriptional regulator
MNLNSMSEKAILNELGSRIQRERLNQNMPQNELAIKAGISRKSLQNLESGHPCTTSLLLRILRVMGKLEALDAFLPKPGFSPIQLAKLKGHERQRAGRHRQ